MHFSNKLKIFFAQMTSQEPIMWLYKNKCNSKVEGDLSNKLTTTDINHFHKNIITSKIVGGVKIII